MERFAFPRAASVGLLAAHFALGASLPVSAQLGHVVKAQKISSTSGGFSALLEEMDQFGRSIVDLGDFDGDGVTDLLVGAHTDDDGGLDKGSVYVLFMRANGFVKEWRKISDLEGNFSGWLDKGDQFGRAAANLGDLDGDGVTDVAVSANYDDDGGTNKGAVYILFLAPDATVKSSQKISETSGGLPVGLNLHDEFGRSITNLGDMDGDGVIDILVGTPEDDEGGTNTGALHVLFLNPDGTVKGYHRISKYNDSLAIKPTDWFGFCSANLGDFDGDGVTDVAVGAVLDDDGGVNQGSIWVLCLNSDGSVKTAREIDELEGGFTAQLDDIDQFGTSVANLGDLDGDGVTDIAVGAVKDDDGGTPGFQDADVGAVYVLFLNPDASVKSWAKISDVVGGLPYALDQWDWFGSALAPYGGSGGDGLFNAVIGCRNDDDAGGNQGAIYMVQLDDGTVPAADFTAGTTQGLAPLTVGFTDASTGDVTAWQWDLGEGPLSNQQNPTKTYYEPGTYDVQLTARGPRGIDVETKQGFVTVGDGLLADFAAAPRLGPCPLTVTFGDRSAGTVTSWWWDFGDGTGSSERDPVHVYQECGSYTVALTVGGPSGTHTRAEPAFVVAELLPPEAAFSADPSAGPAPLSVQFTDASQGVVTSWAWDFGDGTTSSEQSPLHLYELEGRYTVGLSATGPGGTDAHVEVDLVSVGAPPVAYFDATPTLGPAPLTVAFSDLTTGAVTSWAWDFGDGSTSSQSDPVHVYSSAGSFDVTLTATGPGGSDARARAGLITVESPPPGAAFVATPTAGAAPLAVQFWDLSTNGPIEWLWDFGDGGVSVLQHPSHVYASPGGYSVSLVVTGPGGVDSLALADLITVEVPPTTADFTADPPAGPVPLAVTFTDASSSNVTAWSWSFGDGASSSAANPTHVYSGPGTYTVALTVWSPTGTDTRTRTNLVTATLPPPEASFAAAPASGQAPLAVQFEDRSTGAVTSWSWDFGDSASASEPDPAHTYVAPGAYTVALTVTGPGGSSTFTQVDAIDVAEQAPVADFRADPQAGAAPLAVQFTDLSAGVTTAWAWDFGDGSSSTARSPSHVYANAGTYTVTLTAAGPGGADAETKPGLVGVVAPAPQADFGAAPTSGVAPLSVLFTDASSGTVTSWAWDFGDGSSSSAQGPAHAYASAGTYTVTLTVTGPGGADAETKPGLITVGEPAPTAGFTVSPTSGVAPLSVQFLDASQGAVTGWAWDFGDGSSSSAQGPAHSYASAGTYTVTLSVTGPGGADAETRPGLITVGEPAPTAGFTVSPSSGVAPLSVQFLDASQGVVTGWAWDFGDGTSSSVRSPAHVYSTPATYSVTLTVTGPGGSDVAAQGGLVLVAAPRPVAEFSATPREGYAPLLVAFTDLSTGEILTRSWYFGDGAFSTEQNPRHEYLVPGSFAVTLEVSGPGGTSGRKRTILVREAPVFADGSFEQQAAGLRPAAPWTVFNGSSVFVRASTTGDQGFPSAGANWCDIGAEGSSSARPPTNLHGAGQAPTGTTGIQQAFLFPVAAPHVFFEAAFLLNGAQDSPGRNDFMSVDLSDGVTSWNVFHADSFSEFPLVSRRSGLAMTARERVHVDLAALFPAAGERTVLTMRVSVGNVGGSVGPSRGYVDDFRFAPDATATFRNGTGKNAAFYVSSPAVLGGSWTIDVDATRLPGTRLVLVTGAPRRIAVPDIGGELLVGGPALFTLLLPSSGGSERFVIPVPDDPAMIGRTVATQATLVGKTSRRGNAFDLRMGY